MLLNGEIDLLAGLAKAESRIGVIGYPEFPMGSETYNMVKPSEDDRITTSYDTLNGMRIGALDSAIVQVLRKFLDEHGIAAEIAVFPDHQSLLDAFKWHRVEPWCRKATAAAIRKTPRSFTRSARRTITFA